MSPLGSEMHIESCTLRKLQEASDLCQVNPVLGLEFYEKVIEEDDEIINAIIRRHWHKGGEL